MKCLIGMTDEAGHRLRIVIASLNLSMYDRPKWVKQFLHLELQRKSNEQKWKQFRSYLDKEKKMIDQMYYCVKLYNTGCMWPADPS
ncbi:MAG: hypothetical protein WBP74_04120 [Nitrososphaeraceae archaeon]